MCWSRWRRAVDPVQPVSEELGRARFRSCGFCCSAKQQFMWQRSPPGNGVFDVPGCRDCVVDGTTGFIHAAADIRDLTRVMREVSHLQSARLAEMSRAARAQKISFRRARSQIFRLIWSKRRWKCQLARLSRPVGVTMAIRRLGKVALELEAKSSPETPSKKMRCWFSSIMPVVVPCLRSSGNGAPVGF